MRTRYKHHRISSNPEVLAELTKRKDYAEEDLLDYNRDLPEASGTSLLLYT